LYIRFLFAYGQGQPFRLWCRALASGFGFGAEGPAFLTVWFGFAIPQGRVLPAGVVVSPKLSAPEVISSLA
jgi:hypothetical protein